MLFLFTTSACGRSINQQIKEQLELGQKYLAELNYEEAVIAFQKVIELDEKNVEAYVGLNQAYSVQNDFENAVEILKKG